MKKTKEDMVVSTINMQKEMNDLSVDKISYTAPKEQEIEIQTKMTAKQIAAAEGVQYIEPIRKFQAFGILPEKWKKEHDADWEYVKGIFENEVVRGDPFRFTFSKWPGDPDCMWEVPSNKPVYVPRMIAKLLSGEKDESTGIQAMQYHSFNHIARPETNWNKDEFTHQFAATGTYSRGKFRAIGAFQ